VSEPESTSAIAVRSLKRPLDPADEALLLDRWQLLAQNRARMMPRALPALPWEQSSLMTKAPELRWPELRGGEPILRPTPSSSSSVAPVSRMRQLGAPAWGAVATRLSSLRWTETDDAARQRALQRIKLLLQSYTASTGLGRTLLEDILSLRTDSHLDDTLCAVFGQKATKTLTKRTADFIRFVNWAAEQDLTPLPVQESSVFKYLTHLRKQGAAPSSLSTFLQSLNFSDRPFKLMVP